MPIVFTGVRPGEKLEEKLWEDGAMVELTENAEIFRVREGEWQGNVSIRPLVDDVIAAAESGDLDRLRLALMMAGPRSVAVARSDDVTRLGRAEVTR